MTPLDVRPLVGRIAEVLRAQIISGELPPGRKLGQDGIARDLGVSRTPVREAFAVLAAEGWLVHRPRAGVEVTGLLAAEVQEITVMRLLLEPFAARLQAQAHSAADDERARALLATAPPQHTDPDWFDQVEAANREFHFLVYGVGSGALPELVEAGILHHWDRLARYRRFHWSAEPEISRSQAAHATILDAWTARDRDRTQREVALHIAPVAAGLVRRLDPHAELTTALREVAAELGAPLV